MTVGSTGNVNSLALTDGGTIGFEWVDAEVAAVLTISGGTVNNSAIGATTPSTGAFTTLSHTGLLSSFGNQTATSTLDFSGAYVIGAASTTLTLNNAGAFGVDTTSGQWKYRDNNTVQVLAATSSIAANFSSSTLRFYGNFGASTSTVLRDGFHQAITVTEISCRSRNATTTGQNAIFQIGTGSATATPVIFCNTVGQRVPITANGAFAANTAILITVGSATTTLPDQIFFDIRYKFDQN